MEKLEEILKELNEKLNYLESKHVVDEDANTFSDGFEEGFEYGLRFTVEKIEKILKEDE